MTSKEFGEVLLSADFQHDLEEMSSYLASIMQERPIVNLFAKCFWKRGYQCELEENLCDLTVSGKKVEFKFNYDRMELVLAKELKKWNDLREMWRAVQSKQTSKSWCVAPRIYADVCIKKPDIFVWILCSRDLSKVEDLQRICNAKEQQVYNANHPYGSNRSFLTVADSFLVKLKGIIPFTTVTYAVKTEGDFPSTYHFLICEFSKLTGQRD